MHSPAVILYGIRTCDTCRKARRWLESHDIPHRYHDLRSDGLDAATLDRWIEAAGPDAVINKRGTTWRKLATELDADLTSAAARDLILSHPTLVKRPIIEADGRLITLGFTSAEQQRILDTVENSSAKRAATP